MTTDLVSPNLDVAVNARLGSTRRIALGMTEDDDLTVTITAVDAAGDPVDISSYVTRSYSVEARGGGAVKASGTPAFVTDGTNGQMRITLASADLAGKPGTWDFEVQISQAAAANVHTLIVGRLAVRKAYI